MFDIKHYLLSIAGAVLGFSIIYPFGPGCVMNLIMGAVVGFPLGIFCGVLIADLPKIGFKSYHMAGFLVSFIPNFVVFLLGAGLKGSGIPWQGTATIVLLLSVTVCLACYNVSKIVLTKQD